MTCRGNQVSLSFANWLGLATLTGTLLLGIYWMKSADTRRIEVLEANGVKQAQAMQDLAIAVTKFSTIVEGLQEELKEIKRGQN